MVAFTPVRVGKPGLPATTMATAIEKSGQGSELMTRDAAIDEDLVRAAEAELILDPNDTMSIISYGSKVETEVSKSFNASLQRVRAKDAGEVGELLTALTVNCKRINSKDFIENGQPEKKGFLGSLLRRAQVSAETLVAKYDPIEKQVDGIEVRLVAEYETMSSDIKLLDGEYIANMNKLRYLTAYIEAAERKLQTEIPNMLEAAKQTANRTNDHMDVQIVDSIFQMKNRLEKRVHNMKLSKQVAIQTGVEVKVIQAGDAELAEQLKSSVISTIPLWKQQFTIGLTLIRQRAAARLQKAVTDMNNDLLTTNSELLHSSSVAIATESERGIVDISTLETVNNNLINTIDDVQKIREEGSARRVESARKLIELDKQLRARLLQES